MDTSRWRRRSLVVGLLALIAAAVVVLAVPAAVSNAHAQPCITLNGTPGDDFLVGTEGPDCIFAGAGDDEVIALGGNDIIILGSGDDFVDSFGGDDNVYGGLGDDFVSGSEDNDNVFGGPGFDVFVEIADGPLETPSSNDNLYGESGVDIFEDAGPGIDVCNGGPDFDFADGSTCESTPGVEFVF
jgi:Ca2+-binding RTX toxin-like protein